jgi:hypothetical protein
MALLSSLKTFFEKVGAEIEKLFGGPTSLAQQVQAVITYVAPLVNTIVVLADPAIAPLVAGVIAIVQADLATVSVVVQGATPTPGSTVAQTLTTALGSIKNNLSGLLTDAGVKNSANFAKISSIASLVMAEADAILAKL